MPLADTLLRLAERPAMYAARWTDEIMVEVTRTLVGKFGRPPKKGGLPRVSNEGLVSRRARQGL